MKTIMMAAAAVSILGLAACGQSDTGSATTYDLSLYPSCDALPGGFDEAVGCTLYSEAITQTFLASREAGVTKVQVIGDGELMQTIEVQSTAPVFIPTLSDLNGDEVPELLIPLDTSNVNTTYSFFFASQEGIYTEGGDFTGIGWGPSATGLLAVPARSSAASYEVKFFDIGPGGLSTIASVETSISEEGAAPICRLHEGASLGGMTPEEAQALYCGDPAVAGIFE